MTSQDVLFPLIDGVVVDLQSLASITHSCRPDACTVSRCCCARYEVTINETELPHIINAIPQASRYASGLRSGKGFRNVFEYEGNHTYSIDKNGRGGCVFGYKDTERKFSCSLHTAAVDLKIPVRSVKPLACILWPLAVVESDPKVLSIQDDVLEFSCNQEQRPPGFMIDRGIAQNIEMAFGGAFLNAIQATVENLKRKTVEGKDGLCNSYWPDDR